jgi:hypothetical protein
MATQTIGYLPGQDPGDMQANEEYQQALQRMLASLDARKNRMFDPTMLAMAQGFLAPTNTGSFGESLGSALGGLRAAQEEEAKFEQDLAQQRLALAGQGLNLQRQKARERAFEGMMRPAPAGGAGEPSEAVPGAPEGPVAPTGAGEVAGSVAQAPPQRLGVKIAPAQQFQTREQFMAAQRLDPSISPAQAMKAWEDYQKGMREIRESGMFDRSTGEFFATPKPELVERQIYGSTYRVPMQIASRLDDAQASGDEQTYQAIAGRFLQGMGQPVKSTQQSEADKAREFTRATKLAEEAAKREGEAMRKLETAMGLDQVTRRLMNYVSQSPQAFGIFQRPGWMSAIGGLINDGITAGQTRVAMGGFEDFVRKNLPGIKQADLDNISRAVGDFAELELQFRRLYLTGQGAVSNMEAEVVRRVPGNVSDSPQSLMTKTKLLQMRAQHERKVGETWREMKRQNRDLSYLDFEISPVYETLIKQYDDALKAEFDQPARPTGAAQPTVPKRQPGPATRQPAPPGYGNARRRVDQLLGD